MEMNKMRDRELMENKIKVFENKQVRTVWDIVPK